MRLDRLITLGFMDPLYRSTGGWTSRRRLPVLMYHSISDDPETGASPYYKTCTTPDRFGEHMSWLASAGWRGTTLTEALASFQAAVPPAGQAKLVAITFDDGFRDFHIAAFPALRKHGFTATMYLPTAFISQKRQRFLGRECMTWDEVTELVAAGMEFGSHTVNHPKLIHLTWPEIETELRNSKLAIEEHLAIPCMSFAYPFAFPQADRPFARRFRELLAATGYASAVTTTIGRAASGANSRQLSRLPVNSVDDRPLFEAKLRGAYDWLAAPQGSFKLLKQLLKYKSSS